MAVGNGINEQDVEEQPQDKKKLKYPKSVFFIISNEFCERFSYYGMRTVLALYLKDALHYDESTATIIYHTFVMLCYFTPLFGGIMADAWLGKFKTILYISILYAIGNIVLAFGSVESLSIPHSELSILGLLLIALGTGGIKPCVSSFGGDQFVLPQQEKQLERFFSVFYFSINAGSVISSFLTPVLREMHCLGSKKDCFPFAFGLPAILMIVSVVVFVVGSPMYKRSKPSGNIAVDVGCVVGHAVVRKTKVKGKRDHWLDHADDKYDNRLIEDIKVLMKLALLFSPTIVFWALFEQQGSKWTFQATRLDGDLGGFVVQPDQMQTLNAVLVLIFIPLFQYVVYPVLAKLRLVRTPLQKLCVGGFLAAIAFVISGILEIQIQKDTASLPSSGQSQLHIYNSLHCPASFKGPASLKLPPFSHMSLDLMAGNQSVTVTSCQGEWKGEIGLNGEQVSSYLLFKNADNTTNFFPLNLNGRDEMIKSETTDPLIKLIYSGTTEIEVSLVNGDNNLDITIPANSHQSNQMDMEGSGTFAVHVKGKELTKFDTRQGGIYVLMIDGPVDNLNSTIFTVVAPNSISMMWQIPQYVIITAAEIMFSITGLEFSYSQSPDSLKSIISSLWLLTDALGNVIILIIEGFKISDTVLEMFIYAVVMAISMLVFTFLAYRYKYVTPSPSTSELDIVKNEDRPEEKTKRDSKEVGGFVNYGADDIDENEMVSRKPNRHVIDD